MTTRRLAPALAIVLTATGCAHSPPTLLLTLDAVPPVPATIQGGYRGPPLAVPAVHLPAAFDRLGYTVETSAGALRVDDFAHWAAAPGLLARDALVRDLTARLPAGAVLPPGASGGGGTRTIDITVLALGIRADGSNLHAAWRTLPAGPVQEAVLSGPGASTPADGARAMSTLLGLLADRLASNAAAP